MAQASLQRIIEELQFSQEIEGETLDLTSSIQTVLEDGFIFVAEEIEGLKNILTSDSITVEQINSDDKDSDPNEAVEEEKKTQSILQSGLLSVANNIADLSNMFAKRTEEERANDMQLAENEREAANARLKEGVKGVGNKALDMANNTGIGRTLMTIGGTIQGVWQGIAAVSGFMTNTIAPLLTGKKGFLSLIKGIGKVVKRLALPLTALLAGFRGLFTFFTKKDELGAFEAFKQGLTDFASTFFGWMVDIPLWLLEKISGFFGLDFLSQMFAEMNFRDGFLQLFDWFAKIGEGIGSFISKAINISKWVIDKIMNPIDTLFEIEGKIAGFIEKIPGVGDIHARFREGMKAMVAKLLPDPTGGWLSPSGIAAKAIPSSVYRWAGIDKKTGEKLNFDDSNVSESVKEMSNEDRQTEIAKYLSFRNKFENEDKFGAAKRAEDKLKGLGYSGEYRYEDISSQSDASGFNSAAAARRIRRNRDIALSVGDYDGAAALESQLVDMGESVRSEDAQLAQPAGPQQSAIAQAYISDTADINADNAAAKSVGAIQSTDMSDNSTRNTTTIINSSQMPARPSVADY